MGLFYMCVYLQLKVIYSIYSKHVYCKHTLEMQLQVLLLMSSSVVKLSVFSTYAKITIALFILIQIISMMSLRCPTLYFSSCFIVVCQVPLACFSIFSF